MTTQIVSDGAGEPFDVVVVGGGHAGCEAALAAARIGCSTLLLTLNLEKIALMPCNPAVGGVGKGQLTREIDALGGEQGRNADRSCIQMKMLNTGKGPAVRALRAQTDKKLYEDNMKRALSAEPRLRILEGTAASLDVSRETITGVTLADGSMTPARAVVLACGTFLNGRIVIGEKRFPAGRMGEPPAESLSDSLRHHGIELGRFQSATPPRIDARSIDTSKMLEDPGDSHPTTFSYFSGEPVTDQVPCYLTYTTEETHDVVRRHLHLSPIKTGSVSGKGPRYCPSIDRKVINFPERDRHPVFVEPEGRRTRELYLQGLTTSLPVWVQEKVIRSTPGLEHARLMRPGYAVEYDFVIPSQLSLSLEHRGINGLFMAGQINGTSGYEEAAAQGLLAGINAALHSREKDSLIIGRDQGYIGVLIDDLVTKGVDEPYRMFTSRAEYRLLLRHDNAHSRLSSIGNSIGLLPDAKLNSVNEDEGALESLLELLKKTRLPADSNTNSFLESLHSAPIGETSSPFALLKRPVVTLAGLQKAGLFEFPEQYRSTVITRAEIEIKYAGYIDKQEDAIKRSAKLEQTHIPADFPFADLTGLAIEARDQLTRVRPDSLGQASRIPGVSPADISILSLYLKQYHEARLD